MRTYFYILFFVLFLIDEHCFLLYCHLLYRHWIIPTSTRPSLDLRSPSAVRNAFTPAKLEEHRALFASFDEDGGGTIDAEEMAALGGHLGLKLTKAAAINLIAEIDLVRSIS